MGCGGKEDKAKEDGKKESKQTVQKTEGTTGKNQQDKFNHSASLKINGIATQMSGVQDPLVVVYGKEAVMAYKLKGEENSVEVEKKLKQNLKRQMPDYQIYVSGDPEWYRQVAVLYQDSIDSEGRTVKDLRKTFQHLKENNKK